MRPFVSKLDHIVLEYLYSIRTDSLNDLFLFITILGSANFIGVFSVLLGLYLLLRGRFKLFVALSVSVLGTALSVFLLKIMVGRARPLLDLAFYFEKSLSFPSAHAAVAMAFFGYLALLFYRLSTNRMGEILVTIIAIILILLIGMSRMYLGVHYLSDVLGGYLVGSFWLYIAYRIINKKTA